VTVQEAPPRSILFACTSNALRSPMAAGLMQRRFGPITRVESVGVAPGEAVDALAAVVMDEAGVDIGAHVPRGFESLNEAHFDLIVSLSPEAHHHALELTPQLARRAEYWPTLDPSLREGSREQRLMEYRGVREALDARIASRFSRPSTG
jgi:protein-tyrosine-phosphatase